MIPRGVLTDEEVGAVSKRIINTALSMRGMTLKYMFLLKHIDQNLFSNNKNHVDLK